MGSEATTAASRAGTLAEMAVDPDFIFQKVHPLRSFSRTITSSPFFEVFIIIAIFANLVCLTAEDVPASRSAEASFRNTVIRQVDFCTLMVFSFEFVVKVLSMGLMPLPAWAPSFLRPDRTWVAQPPDPPASTAVQPEAMGETPSLPAPNPSHHRTGEATTAAEDAGAAAAPGGDVPGAASEPHMSRTLTSSGTPRDATGTPRRGRRMSSIIRDVVDTKTANLLIDSMRSEKQQFYFRDGWNRLDFIMLLIGWVGVFSPAAGSTGLSALRAVRALRPLRAFRFFAPLQSIVESIWRSARFVGNVFVCLGFFYLLFGLMGQQFFQGAMQRRCVRPHGLDAVALNVSSPSFPEAWARLASSPDAAPREYVLHDPATWCSLESEPRGFQCSHLVPSTVDVDVSDTVGYPAMVTVPLVCTDTNVNPNQGQVSFDNIGGAIYSVFVMSSLEVRLP